MADKIHWHFIGHLQTNKVKKAVGRFALIHSVDSIRLAEEISREATAAGITQAVLLQVKVVPDPSKSGFTPEQLRQSIDQIMSLPNLQVEGLMTIAPFTADEDIWQTCFDGLRDLRDELESASDDKYALKELSMGMTQDWEAAVESGATMIRLGRAVFGP
jgi:pyridoxal phosphate enzyme (YggS family)